MKNKFNSNQHKLRTMVLLMVITLIYAGIINRLFPPKAPIDIKKAPAFIADTLIQRTQAEILLHNEILRNIIIQRMTIESNGIIARESSKMQTRGFYLAILAVLLASIINYKDLTIRKLLKFVKKTHARHTAENISSKQNVCYILLFLIVIVFALEVHQNDLNIRYNQVYYSYSDAVRQLCDSSEINKTWQVFDNSKINEQLSKASEFCMKWPRVISIAFRPSVDQVVLYFLPFIVIVVETLSSRNKNIRKQ